MADTGKMESSYSRRNVSSYMSGELYEVNLCMLLFVRSLSRADTFEIASNMEKAGCFDDIVLSFKGKEAKQKKTYLIQVKHKRKASNIDLRAFSAAKGDFSLLKYFWSYLEVKKNFPHSKNTFIVYTNTKLKSEGCSLVEENDFLNMGGKVYRFTEESDEYKLFKNVEAYKNIIQEIAEGNFTVEEMKNKLKNSDDIFVRRNLLHLVEDKNEFSELVRELNSGVWDQFMKDLQLYTEQTGLEGLENLVRKELDNLCGTSSVFLELKDEILSWWRSSDHYLNENADFFWETLHLHASQLMPSVTSKLSALSCLKLKPEECVLPERQAIHIMCGDSTELSCLKLLQSLSKEKPVLVDIAVLLQHVKEILFLWNHYHILVVVDGVSSEIGAEIISQLSNALHSDHDKRIIVITNKMSTFVMKLGEMFASSCYTEMLNLSQFTAESQELVMNCDIEFQGHFVKLKSIVIDPVTVTSEVIIKLLRKDENLKVGCMLPPESDTFIDRRLLRWEILRESIFESAVNDCFAFKGFTLDELHSVLPSEMPVDKLTDSTEINTKCKHFIIDGITSFESLCEVYETVHWLEKTGNHLVWRKSKGDIKLIKNNLELNADPVMYESICKIADQLVLIVAGPGMGKTWEAIHLSNVSKKLDPSTWVLTVKLSHCTRILSQGMVGALGFLLEAGSFSSLFEKTLFEKELMHRGNVLIIFDAFDEITPVYSNEVVSIVKKILGTKASKICITSRPGVLEEEFATLAFSLSHFTREDQVQLLLRSWETPDCSRAESINFAGNLLDSCAKMFNFGSDDFMASPLQCSILAQIFQFDSQKSKDFNLDLLQLYGKFIDQRFKQYFHKYQIDLNSFSMIELANDVKHKYIKEMCICAIVNFLNDDELAMLANSSVLKNKYCKVIDKLKQFGDKRGLIEYITNDDKAIFIHRSMLEYFVALWLSRNFMENQELISRRLFDSDWQLVKAFLDRILCMNLKLHRAVIHQDMTTLQQLLDLPDIAVNEKDSGGRTALHLAVIDQKMLVKLLDHDADVSVCDMLCKWTPLMYAAGQKMWTAVDTLLMRGADDHDLELLIEYLQDKKFFDEMLIFSGTQGLDHIQKFVSSKKYTVHQ